MNAILRFAAILSIAALASVPVFAHGGGSHSSGSSHCSGSHHSSHVYIHGNHISTHPHSSTTQHHHESVPGERDSHGRLKRSTAAKDAFKHGHPCPSTGKTTGACPGYVIDHNRGLEAQRERRSIEGPVVRLRPSTQPAVGSVDQLGAVVPFPGTIATNLEED